SFRKNYVGFAITITRCTGYADVVPTPEEQMAVAEQTYADAWALWNYLWNEERSGALFTICGGVFNDRMTPITPSGGCTGWVFSFRAEIQGYESSPRRIRCPRTSMRCCPQTGSSRSAAKRSTGGSSRPKH